MHPGPLYERSAVPRGLTLDLMFRPLDGQLDHRILETQMLDTWEREGTFARLREKNKGGQGFRRPGINSGC